MVNKGISTSIPRDVYPRVIWETNPRYPFELENSVAFFWLLEPKLSFILTNTKESSVETVMQFRVTSPPNCPQNISLEISDAGSLSSFQLSGSEETLVSHNLRLQSFKRTQVTVKFNSLSCALSSTDQREAYARISDIHVSDS